jgi:hypothetical protein
VCNIRLVFERVEEGLEGRDMEKEVTKKANQ